MRKRKFKRGPKSILNRPHEHPIFQFTGEHVRGQAENPRTGLPDPGRLAAMPKPARTVYFLWIFRCEAAANGLEVFILNGLGCFSREVHAALKEVGARELAQRLEMAIALARHACAEFKRLPDTTWFEQFDAEPRYATLHALDEDGTYDLVENLTATVVAYIRVHRRALFDG